MIEQLQHAFDQAAQLAEAQQALLAEFIQEKIADLETEFEPDEPMVWNTSSGRDPLADPRHQTFEEFFRELGVSDEEIEEMRALMEEEEAE